jgi:hypothetical protein
MAVERQAKRRRVANLVIEEAQVELVDGGIHQQAIDVCQLAHDADSSAGDRCRERRQSRLERTDVRIERGIADVEGHFRVHLRRQRDAAGPRDGEARGRRLHLEREQIAFDADVADHLPDPLVAGEEVADGAVHVEARLLEGAAAAGGEIEQAGERNRGLRGQRQVLHRNRTSIDIERVGPVPSHVGRPGAHASALHQPDVVEPHPGAFEAQPGARRLERLPVGDALVDRHRSEPERPLVIAVDAELPREQPVHGVVIDVESAPQVRHRPPHQAHPGVQLLATVTARVSGREASFRFDRRVAPGDDDVLHVDVSVLDDRGATRRPPLDVPGAHPLARERPFDARTGEAPQHQPVERAVAADRNRVGRGAEGRQDAGEQPIALLPIGARDVKRNA